jgi:hypothetical protein
VAKRGARQVIREKPRRIARDRQEEVVMNRREFIEQVAATSVLASVVPSAVGSDANQQSSASGGMPTPAAPEPKSATEALDIEQKAERIWSGQETVTSSYPYVLPHYKLQFPHLGTESQTFIDNYMVEWLYDLDRVMETPEKHPEAVIRPNDFPWEAFGNPLPSALYDTQDRIFKMWYCVSFGASPYNFTQVMCYAESDDGIRWRKPTDRGGLPFENHSKTNIVLQGVAWHSAMKEPAESDPQKRYKFVFWDSMSDLKFGAAYSADGYRAERIRVTPFRLSHNSGTFWDPAIRKYASYGQHGHHWNWLYRVRGVGRQESEDLLKWSPRQAVMLPDGNLPPSTEFGTMVAHKEGSLYLGTVSRYDMEPIWQSRGTEGSKFNWRDYVHPDQLLAYSRDGIHWSFASNGKVWLENGPPGSLDYGYADLFSPPVRHNGKLYFYYLAARHKQAVIPDTFERVVPKELRRAENFREMAFAQALTPEGRRDLRAVALATLRQDGYVRVRPVHNTGALLTRQFVFEGDRLYVNVNADFGWMQVEVLDDTMSPVNGFGRDDCDLIRGNSVSHEVRWKGNPDVRSLWNRPIRLKIHVTDCWLYSFRFGYSDGRDGRG